MDKTLQKVENQGSNHQIFNDKIVESNGLFSLYSKLLLELRRGHSCHFLNWDIKLDKLGNPTSPLIVEIFILFSSNSFSNNRYAFRSDILQRFSWSSP